MTEPATHAAPTMRDVARAAGVSVATVSIVMRGAPGVGEETRARVLAVAEDLGYRANRTARLMKLRRTRHLGVAMSPRNAFHAEVVEGIQAAAAAAGYELVLSLVTPGHTEQRAVETLEGFRCESLILLGSDLSDAELAALASRLPVVLVARGVTIPGVDVVRSADQRGQRLLVDHLVALGHRDIAYVDGGPHPVAVERRRGYLGAMRRAGLGEHIRLVTGGQAEEDGRRAADELLRERSRPTAVCAFNDQVAVGVADTLAQHGVAVPGACSVTGYDDSGFSRLRAIDLTTVNQQADDLARAAVEAAIARLDAPAGPGGSRPATLLEPRLVVRGTTAPLR